MTGNWAGRDIFTGIFDEVIISVLSKEDPRIQALLCPTVKLNRERRFHFPSSWPQPLVFLFPWPPSSPSCPSPFSQAETGPELWLLLWCCCSVELFLSPPWTKRRTTKSSNSQAEGNVRAETGPLLLAAPRWEQEQRPGRRWVLFGINRFLQRPLRFVMLSTSDLRIIPSS